MTADASGLRVLAGPSEATAAGNIAAQMIACGEVTTVAEARGIIRDSFEIAEFKPRDAFVWDEKAARFEKLLPTS
jgi:sugar (pentulose or hexulose) kinase